MSDLASVEKTSEFTLCSLASVILESMSEIRRDTQSQIRPPFFNYGSQISSSGAVNTSRPVSFFSSTQFGSMLSTLQGLHGGWTSFLGGATANQVFTPFWSNLLEGQNSNVSMTMKFPSDNEDSGCGCGTKPSLGGGSSPPMMTMKYPSDNEDGGTGGVKPPFGDIGSMTQRWPSDNEDAGGGVGGPPMMTRKYPSDNEDGGGVKPPFGGGVGGPPMATMKYPSDNDEGDGGIKPPFGGIGDIMTKRWPSDNEDAGGGVVGPPMMTMKYPSDNEDGGARNLG